MLDVLISGGWMMIPIMGCSLIAMTVVFERWFFFRTIQHVSQVNEMITFIRQGKFTDALAINERVSNPTLRVISAGLRQPDHTTKAMEAAGIQEVTAMRRGLPSFGYDYYACATTWFAGNDYRHD